MNKQIIFIIIFVLALLGAGYNIYQSSNVIPQSNESSQENNNLVKDLSKLRHLKDSKLDTTLFQNPLYKNLESAPDLGTQTPAEPPQTQKIGRPNPFLPASGQSSIVTNPINPNLLKK